MELATITNDTSFMAVYFGVTYTNNYFLYLLDVIIIYLLSKRLVQQE